MAIDKGRPARCAYRPCTSHRDAHPHQTDKPSAGDFQQTRHTHRRVGRKHLAQARFLKSNQWFLGESARKCSDQAEPRSDVAGRGQRRPDVRPYRGDFVRRGRRDSSGSMRRKRIESATEQPVVPTILVILARSFPPVLLAFRNLMAATFVEFVMHRFHREGRWIGRSSILHVGHQPRHPRPGLPRQNGQSRGPITSDNRGYIHAPPRNRLASDEGPVSPPDARKGIAGSNVTSTQIKSGV